MVGAAKGTIFGILLPSPPLLTRKYFNLMQYFEFNVDCKYKIIIRKKSARTSEVLKERSLTKTLLIIEFSLRKEMFLKSEKGDRIRRILFICINNIQQFNICTMF